MSLDRLPVPLLRLFGIPVPHHRLFTGRNQPTGGYIAPLGRDAQVLDGDLTMPPTAVSGFWSFLNPIRNVILAQFLWKTYSVLEVSVPYDDVKPVLVMFGGNMVLPRKIWARFILVKHGREACSFSIVNQVGVELPFVVVTRGTLEEVTRWIYQILMIEVERDETDPDEVARKVINLANDPATYTVV